METDLIILYMSTQQFRKKRLHKCDFWHLPDVFSAMLKHNFSLLHTERDSVLGLIELLWCGVVFYLLMMQQISYSTAQKPVEATEEQYPATTHRIKARQTCSAGTASQKDINIFQTPLTQFFHSEISFSPRRNIAAVTLNSSALTWTAIYSPGTLKDSNMISAVYSLFSGVFNGGSVCETKKKPNKHEFETYIQTKYLTLKKEPPTPKFCQDESFNNSM